MDDKFFTRPILNSPYESPSRHWELDEQGQPTQQIIESRRRAEFITPIPKPKKRKGSTEQTSLLFDEGKGLSTAQQQYDHTAVINAVRQQVDQWRRLPNPNDWRVTPETARLLQHWRHHSFTGTVAEQWGRRWITIDTSRVALALARARIMGARYPYYLLADSRDGQIKEAEVTRTAPSSQPTHVNIRYGFVYERVSHITLKSIANNAEIDVIWDKWQAKLEPMSEKLNTTLKKTWQEWEIPREVEATWPAPVKKLHADWWQARIARQKEIDASIATKAEFEYLYDKPYDDKKKVRVAGPFTVESLSPHRVLDVDENDELIDTAAQPGADYAAKQTFPQMILENLKTAGVQQAHKEDRITFTALHPWPGALVCAEGRYIEGNAESGAEKRAAIFIGPEFGTVSRLLFLGMIRQSMVRNDSGKETFLGLGEVVRSSALRDFIDRRVQPLLISAA